MSTSETPRIRRYTWEEIIQLCDSLAVRIAEAGVRPSAIIAVLRGGAFPALILSHRWSVHQMYAVRASVTMTDAPRAKRVDQPVVLGAEGIPHLDRETVLLVDDVTNTGGTLATVRKAVFDRLPTCRIYSAAILWDTIDTDGISRVPECAADFWAGDVHAWVAFPWESTRP